MFESIPEEDDSDGGVPVSDHHWYVLGTAAVLSCAGGGKVYLSLEKRGLPPKIPFESVFGAGGLLYAPKDPPRDRARDLRPLDLLLPCRVATDLKRFFLVTDERLSTRLFNVFLVVMVCNNIAPSAVGVENRYGIV